MESAVFLDRDNTLIANDGDLGDPSAVKLCDGVAAGLAALHDAGYRLVVVTNQGGVARGKFSESDVDAVNQRIATLVDEVAGRQGIIDRFYYCPYHPEATVAEYRRDHPWRKPHPGMILQAARDLGIDLAHSWMVGDQERDVLAGRASGCRTILVNANGTTTVKPTVSVKAFPEAVHAILQDTGHGVPVNGTFAHAQAALQAQSQQVKGARPDQAASRAHVDPAAFMKDLATLRRALLELTEEMRSSRLRKTEFSPLRLACGLGQLLAVLLAALGLLHMASSDTFYKWMTAAVLVQLATIALLLVDNRH